MFLIIDKISDKIEKSTNINPKTIEKTSETLKDISAIFAQWAKAKLEKPTLENEKLKAEIAERLANTKKTLAETEKIESETYLNEIELNHKSIIYHIEELERMFGVLDKLNGARIKFLNEKSSGTLFIGGDPQNYIDENNNLIQESE